MIVSRVYNSLSELPMFVFIRCIIHQDYRSLKKSKGFIKMSKLKSVWESLFLDYMSLSGDGNNLVLFNSVKTYQSLVTKIKIIDDCLDILSKHYSKDIADLLNKVGYPFPDNKDVFSESYQKSIKKINTQAKRLVFEANRAKSAIDDFDKNLGSDTIKESDFEEMFLILSKNQGYKMNAHNTTASEFITLIKFTEKQSKDVKRG